MVLLTGDPFLVDQRLAELQRLVVGERPAFGALETLQGDRIDAMSLSVALQTMPPAPQRLVVLRRADRMKDELQRQLLDLLDGVPRQTTLAILAEAPDMRRALFAGLKTRGRVEACEIGGGRDVRKNRQELLQLARAIAGSRGLDLAPDALELLVDHVQTDAGRMSSEIEKLSLRHGDARVTSEQVVESIGGERALTAFAFENAIRERRLDRAIAELRRAFAQGERAEVLVGQLAGELRSLLRARALLDAGMDEASAIRAFGGGRGFFVVPRARAHRRRDLLRALHALAELDVDSKNGATASAQRLERLLAQLIAST